MTTPDFLSGNFEDNPSPAEAAPQPESKRHLLDLVTTELETSGAHLEEVGQLIKTIFPADQRCSLNLFAHTGGRVNPQRPNLLASIVRTDWGANRFAGPHQLTTYDVLAIPDGLHMIKRSSITSYDQPLRTLESSGAPTDTMEAYLAVVSLIDSLSEDIVREQESRPIEAAVGTDFVSEADVQELIRLIEGPRVDSFGRPLEQ